MRNPAIQILLLTTALAGPMGCTHYQAMDSRDQPIRIAVLPVLNRSELPQIIAPLARNLREKLAHSPNWKLVNEDDAVAVLQVTVQGFTRAALARDPGDTGRPLSYNEEVEVSVDWISDLPPPWGDDPVVTVRSDQLLYAQPSLINSETIAMVEIADRLADKIVQRLDWTGSGQ